MWYGSIGQLDSDLPFYLFGAASGVITVLALIVVFIGCCVRGSPPGSSMDFFVALGSMLLSVTVLVRGVTPEWADIDQLNTLCELFPACLLVGLAMVVGGLMVKGWAKFSYARWHLGDKLPISEEWRPSLWMWLILVVSAVVVVVWAVQYDSLVYLDTELTTAEHPVLVCEWEREFEWQVASSAWIAFLLILALISVLANCVSSRQSCSLASDTSLVIVNTAGCAVAGVVVHFAADTSPTAYYPVTGALILWTALFANAVFLIVRVSSRKKPLVGGGGEESYDTIRSESSLGHTMGRDDDLILEERAAKRSETFNY